MQYIIVDLEWNQPMSYESSVYKRVGDRLIFEMIQIGAVKVTEDLRIVDSISIPIQPTQYVRIHPRIQKMTQLGDEILENALRFPEAMAQFAAWCGEDYSLLTWGCDDVSVLKQNMDFFQCDIPLPPLCDIQCLFSAEKKLGKDRKGLKAAMDMLEIAPDEDKEFHNAQNDAYYTAQVFCRLEHPEHVLRYPQTPKKLCHAAHPRRVKHPAQTFDSLKEAIDSPEAQKPRCPVCGRETALEAPYVKQCGDKYVALSRCKDHGVLFVRLRFAPMEDGTRTMTATVALATTQNRAYVHTKQLQVKEKERRWLQSHDSLPDPERELDTAAYTSMPFEE